MSPVVKPAGTPHATGEVRVAHDGTYWIAENGVWVLPCNGTTTHIESYPALYGAIGDQYGEAPPGEFRLPDLRSNQLVVDMPDAEVISGLLDEVYELRRVCAYTAQAIQADLSLKTFPKSRRLLAESRIERLRKAANGYARHVNLGVSGQVLRAALRDAGAKETLTRAQWVQERMLGR